VIRAIPGGYPRFVDALRELATIMPNYYVRPAAITRVFVESGHDALEVVEAGFTTAIGGSQLVIFDPRKVLVVEDSRMIQRRRASLDPLTNQSYLGCDVCRLFLPQGGLPRCVAYSDGIPLPILSGDLPHDRPLPGDHGIRCEPVDVSQAVLDEPLSARASAWD
jgi:hypothetical protein